MRAVLVVRNPSMPDIVFLSADKAVIQHLNKSAIDSGLMMEDELVEERLDISVATQFFSPIIASQGAMTNSLHTPYQSITCENGFVLVLQQFGDHLYIALNGDGEESEEFLQRKLLVFNRLITFHYGPVVERMGPGSMHEREIVWQELESVLHSWADLYHKEQSFLVEALERLQVNQTVNEMCISLLENVLLKLKGAGDKNAVHAMIIVHAKLLALYSSRRASELQSSDLLLITLLAHSFFPTADNAKDIMSPNQTTPKEPGEPKRMDFSLAQASNSGEEYISAGEEGSESSYYSPGESDDPLELLDSVRLDGHNTLTFESAKLEISSTPSQSEDDDDDEDTDENQLSVEVTLTEEEFHTPVGIPPVHKTKIDGVGGATALPEHEFTSAQISPTFPDPQLQGFIKSLSFKSQRVSIAPSDIGSSGERKDCVRMTAFLQLISCNCAPHTLYFAPILPGITLVVLSEMRVQLAKMISQCLFLLDLINRRQSGGSDIMASGKNIEETLEGLIKQVCEQARRLKHTGLNEKQRALLEQWELVKQCGLQKYIDDTSGAYISPRLESVLPEVTKLLKKIFEIRYIGNWSTSRTIPEKIESAMYDLQLMLQCDSWMLMNTVSQKQTIPLLLLCMSQQSRTILEKIESAMYDLQLMLQDSMCHYEQYLAVKAQRNITMTTYLEDFPGLVHFIHIDRKTNQLTAPSINMTSQISGNATKASVLLRNQVWSMVNQMHGYLQQGYFTIAVRGGDFYYSYFLYFEDMAGKLITVQKPLKTERAHGLPGILTGSLYKDVVQRCFPNAPNGSVRCCELMCLHLSVVPLHYITAHARRLCRSLWETSGEATTPVNLL